MIKIDLLPPELQGKKPRVKTPGKALALSGNLLVVLVALATCAVCFAFGHNRFSKVVGAQKALADAKTRLEAKQTLRSEKEEKYGEMMVKWEIMQDQQEILKVLMPENRLLWSEKLNMLANLVPEGVYITEIRVEEEFTEVETQKSQARRRAWEREKKRAEEESEEAGEEPEAVMKPVIKQTATIRAIATSENTKDRFEKMIEFIDRLSDYEMTNPRGEVRRFMDQFEPEIEYGPMEFTDQDGVPVWDFEVKLKSLPFGFDPAE